MSLTIIESNDCSQLTVNLLQDSGAKYADGSSFNWTLTIYDRITGDTTSQGGTKSSVKGSTFNFTASELKAYGDTFVDGEVLKDSIWVIFVKLANSSSDTCTVYTVVYGNIENELYLRIRRNVNNELVDSGSYKETLYMYTMLKSLQVLSSLADNEQIVKILNMLEAISVMNKYCAYDQKYYNI